MFICTKSKNGQKMYYLNNKRISESDAKEYASKNGIKLPRCYSSRSPSRKTQSPSRRSQGSSKIDICEKIRIEQESLLKELKDQINIATQRNNNLNEEINLQKELNTKIQNELKEKNNKLNKDFNLQKKLNTKIESELTNVKSECSDKPLLLKQIESIKEIIREKDELLISSGKKIDELSEYVKKILNEKHEGLNLLKNALSVSEKKNAEMIEIIRNLQIENENLVEEKNKQLNTLREYVDNYSNLAEQYDEAENEVAELKEQQQEDELIKQQLKDEVNNKLREVDDLRISLQNQKEECIKSIQNAIDSEKEISEKEEEEFARQIEELNKKIRECDVLIEKTKNEAIKNLGETDEQKLLRLQSELERGGLTENQRKKKKEQIENIKMKMDMGPLRYKMI